MNFISNMYMYGVSKVLTADMFEENASRKKAHVVAPLRTFYVDLYRKINPDDHKDK